ncbi:hypothetical protein RFI_09019, partial [Reticulomyxa filosa]
ANLIEALRELHNVEKTKSNSDIFTFEQLKDAWQRHYNTEFPFSYAMDLEYACARDLRDCLFAYQADGQYLYSFSPEAIQSKAHLQTSTPEMALLASRKYLCGEELLWDLYQTKLQTEMSKESIADRMALHAKDPDLVSTPVFISLSTLNQYLCSHLHIDFINDWCGFVVQRFGAFLSLAPSPNPDLAFIFKNVDLLFERCRWLKGIKTNHLHRSFAFERECILAALTQLGGHCNVTKLDDFLRTHKIDFQHHNLWHYLNQVYSTDLQLYFSKESGSDNQCLVSLRKQVPKALAVERRFYSL